MKSYLITSTKKSSGKTIITIGLAAALYSMKYKLSVFKKGPDYIDPLWISKSAKAKCYNLDFNTMSNHEIKNLYKSKILNSSISIVEGNKGLFDGVSLDGSDSNAALANLLKLEIILIIDCSGMTRGIAPLVTGYKQFDPKLKYKGIILNNIASDRHEGKVISTINEYTDLKVFGSVHKKNELNKKSVDPSTHSETIIEDSSWDIVLLPGLYESLFTSSAQRKAQNIQDQTLVRTIVSVIIKNVHRLKFSMTKATVSHAEPIRELTHRRQHA